MTPTQRRLIGSMRAATESGTWRRVPNSYGYTIAWDSEERHPTHPGLVDWSGPYRALVFLTLGAGKPILGVSPAPWVGRRDQHITYQRAFEVLTDPGAQVS